MSMRDYIKIVENVNQVNLQHVRVNLNHGHQNKQPIIDFSWDGSWSPHDIAMALTKAIRDASGDDADFLHTGHGTYFTVEDGKIATHSDAFSTWYNNAEHVVKAINRIIH